MPGLLVRVRTGLLIPDGSVRFRPTPELPSDEAEASGLCWTVEESAKLRKTITRLNKNACVRPCICSYAFVCVNHLNQTLKQREPGHTPTVVLTVHEFGSNELLFGVFISRWNVLPDVYMAVLNAEQNSTR